MLCVYGGSGNNSLLAVPAANSVSCVDSLAVLYVSAKQEKYNMKKYYGSNLIKSIIIIIIIKASLLYNREVPVYRRDCH